MHELFAAVQRVQDRKAAAGIPRVEEGQAIYLAETSGPLAGTGLTTEEIENIGLQVVDALLPQVRISGPGPVIGGAWVDGLLAGLALADIRREQETP